jgi:hypothetical protein
MMEKSQKWIIPNLTSFKWNSRQKVKFGMIQEFIEEHLAEQSPISNETMKRVNSLLL